MEHITRRHKNLLLYFLISILSTILDTAVVWLLFSALRLDIVLANTAGVILGFLLHYFLASRSVFQTGYGLAGFAVYLVTFLVGLGLADLIIAYAYRLARSFVSENLAFLLSKGLSVVIPFFFMYYLRLYLYRRLK